MLQARMYYLLFKSQTSEFSGRNLVIKISSTESDINVCIAKA